ncbi:reverse transcriptase domain-containing protein, partial [Oceanospirillum multiglobuliferum]
NSADFVDKIKEVNLTPEQKLVSFDVSALFTSIPTKEAIKVIKEKLQQDPTLKERTNLNVDQIVELLMFCLDTTYFSFDEKFYKQTHGAAMGSPVSPIVANIYMESFEQQALSSAIHTPSIWLRYVDDTFVII